MCGGQGYQPGGPGMIERNSQIGYAGGPGGFEQQFNNPQYQTNGPSPGALPAGSAPNGGWNSFFGAQPGANTSGYGSMGQGGGPPPGGGGFDFVKFMQNPQVMQMIAQMRGGQPQGRPGAGGLLGQGIGARPGVMPPQGLPPGVSIGLTPPQQANPYTNQRGITAPILPPGSMGVRGLR